MVAGPSPNSMPPQGNAEYRKIQELASGGMGSVELARAVSGPHTGEVVALKRLHPHLEREKHFADMFFDEAWITAGLHHPNVVEIFDWGTDPSGRYLALEFVPGDSLLALIRESKKADRMIPIDLALYIIGKTAEGLHAAHELRNEQGALRHLVHRDVTPSNVLVGIHGEVKLIDFGVAKARDKLSHTSTGTIKGKFGYMSPEQARGFPIDRRSDVFSLGVVLWETLALKRLYRSDSELEILRMIVEDPPAPISGIRDDVPPEIENLIAGALAKNRDDRLGSCGEFADFIWAIYHERGFTAGQPEVAAFVKRVMPDRYDAIEQLLSGSHDFIEPTLSRPASGSFSGVGPRPVSGAVPLVRGPGSPMIPLGSQMSSPITADASLPATSYPAPVTEARPNRTPVIAALALVGVCAVAGIGWMVGRRGPSASATTNAASTQGAVVLPSQPPAPGVPVAPPPTVAALVPAVPHTAGAENTQLGAHTPIHQTAHPLSGHPTHSGQNLAAGAPAEPTPAGANPEQALATPPAQPNPSPVEHHDVVAGPTHAAASTHQSGGTATTAPSGSGNSGTTAPTPPPTTTNQHLGLTQTW